MEGWSSDDVSTLREPVRGRDGGWYVVSAVAVTTTSWLRFAEIRCKRDTGTSFGSLSDRPRVWLTFGGGTPSAPGAVPFAGNSVCMKQQRFPYGQEPDTQKV
jgi:hypothetical protein